MNLGWAWSENTPRGGAFVAYGRGQTTVTARIARNLASTNDFTPPLEDGGGGFGALVGGIDEQDYVDRRVTALGLTRAIGSARDALLILDGGAGDDRPEEARLVHSPIGGGRFRLNRWSMPGSYLRGAATLELRPDVTGIFLEPGVGLIVSYEAAHGSLNWQRAELMIAARKNVNDFAFSARAQGGVVSGRVVPPQELFELGGENALPGYGYKQFAGNHAAVAGALAAYGFPVLRRPWRAIGELVIPGLSPGIAAGVQGGWAEASTDAAATAIRHLDPNFAADCVTFDACPAALSTPTKGIRATVDARLTFFGGLIGVGMGRPVDRSARWRLVFRFGQTY
jgi:hypothetical protein